MMNRPKQGKGRPPNQPPEDLIALGRSKAQPTTMKQPLKRDFSEAINTLDNDPNKRQKLDNAPIDENMQSGSETVAQIMKCDEEGDYRQIRQIVEVSMRKLQNTPLNPDPNLYLSLIYSAKVKPKIFSKSIVWDVLASFLKSSTEFHYKKTPLVPVLACNLLLKAFAEVDEWPLEFVQAFLEDSFGDRLWVDDKHTQVFVDNIKTIFPSQKGGTSAPVKSRDPVSHDESENDEDVRMNEAEEAGEIVPETERKPVNTTLVKNRFSEQSKETFRVRIFEMIAMQLNRADANVKNIVAVMSLVISYPSIRLFGSNHLDNWLNNPTTTRYGKELLERIIENCTQSAVEDLETLRLIVRIKIKANTSVNQFYFEKLAKLLGNNPHFPFIALSDFIANEMAPGITKFNPKMLTTIFAAIPIDQRERQVSLILQELAGNKTFNTLLRPVLKAIGKNFPNQFRFDLVCTAIMQEFAPIKMRDDFVREQWVMNVIDLICYSMLMSVPTVLYESPQNLGPREFDSLAIDAKKRIAALQLEAITWSQTVVLELVKQPTQYYFAKVIRKLLLLEPASSYISGDMAPEYERLLMNIVQSDVPVLEETIISVVVMHLKNMPLAQNEALVIIDQLILRAISLVNSSEGVNPIQLANPQFSEALFRLAMFTHAIMEQLGEEAKTKYSFAIRDLFWQVCIILVICAAFNPSTIGRTVWQSYPTIKVLIEMITTRSWKFPPFQFSDCPSPADEQKFLANEGEQILSFENELLGFFKSPSEATKIDAENSVMMKQLMMYSPLQPARRPPSNIIERLHAIEKEFHIGHLLCSSRDPDFLVDIMKRQGPKDSLGWLGPIVKKEEHTLDILPTQCLCYLLYSTQQPEHDIDYTTVPMEKVPRMLNIIRSHFNASSGAPTIEILEFFISRLGDTSRVKREMAQKSLALIFSGIHYNAKTPEQHSTTSQMEEDFEEKVIESSGAIESNNNNKGSHSNSASQSPLPTTPMTLSGAPVTAKFDWLNKLDMLQWFKLSKEIVCDLLLAALVQETEIDTIFNYLLFIYEHKDGDHLPMATEISSLIHSRKLAVTRMFHDSTVYSLFLKILYDGLNLIKTSDKQEVRSDVSTVDVLLKGKKLTLKKAMLEAILELLIFGNLEKISCTVLNRLIDFNRCDVPIDSETKDVLYGLVDDMVEILSHKLLGTYQPNSALSMRLARSPHEALSVPVLPFLSNMDLVILIGSYGLNFDVAKAILNRLDKSDLLEDAASEPNYVKKLSEFMEANGISVDQFVEIVMIYNSMDIIGSDKLLKLFNSDINNTMSEMDTEVEFDFSVQQDFAQLKENKFVSIDAELNSKPAEERITWLLTKAFSGTDPALSSLAYQRLLNMVEIDLVVAQSQGQTMQILKSIQHIFAKVSVGNMEQKFAVELIQDSWRSLPLFELLYRSVKQSQTKEALHQFIVAATKIIDFSKTLADNLSKNSLVDSLNGIVSANHVPHSQQDLQFVEFDFDKYIASKSPVFDAEMVRDLKAHKKIAGFANFDAQKFGTLVFKLIEVGSANLEKILQLFLKPFIEQQSQHNASRMDSVTRVLIGLIRDLSSHYFGSQQKSTILNKEIGQRYFGCLFDWILMFNPDLVHEELFNLIFKKSRDMTAIGLASISQPPFYSLMLSVLIHKTSWAAKRQIFTWLMSRDRSGEELNPSTTLDYIEAYLFHPQSWTGFTTDNEVLFEYKITTQTVPSLHKFSAPELITLTDLIVLETEVLQRRAAKNNDVEEKNRASTTLQKRASLLVCCANQTEGQIHFVLNYLSNKPEINISQLYRIAELLDEPLDSTSNEISAKTLFGFPNAAERLLQAIYIASPVSLYKVLKRDIYLPLKSALLKANTSELDVLVHRIIKKISPNEPASNFAYLTCRKVAAEHPNLVFKYLPNLGSLLEGTSALPLDQFLEKKYHVLYERVLGVFDLLRPTIFEFDGVQPILHHYFDLFGNIELKEEHQFKQLTSLLRALVDFMCQYAAHLVFTENKSAAVQNRLEWIKLRKGVLMAVFKSYPDLTKIEFFANILDQRVSQEEFNSPFIESDRFKQLKADLLRHKNPSRNTGEDQMDVDQSNDVDCLIEELGKYPPNLLGSIIFEVATLTEHPSDLVRQASYKLITKYLHDNPKSGPELVDDRFVTMLSRNKAEGIQLSALIHAPSLFPFANEQDLFLDALFKLGNVASSDIKKIVHEVTQFLY